MGLIQREFEEIGLSTISISLMQGITAKVSPPRTVYVHFPLGRVTGKAFDTETQEQVLKATLNALVDIQVPGEIRKLPFTWKE